jgi:hypothetical protein
VCLRCTIERGSGGPADACGAEADDGCGQARRFHWELAMSTTILEDVKALSTLIADAIIDDDLLRGAHTDASVAGPGRIVVSVDDREFVITIKPTPPTVADMQASSDAPAYAEGDVLVDTGVPGRRLEVLCVGEEAYFVRRLDAVPGGTEPAETAWAFAEAEAATVRAGAIT